MNCESIVRLLDNRWIIDLPHFADVFTNHQVVNKGEYAKYLISGHHEVIIEPDEKDEIP